MPTEHDLTREVSARLKARALTEPLWWLKVHGGPYQRAGVHDYLLCVGGLFATVELKHPTDLASVATPLQRRQATLVQRAGGSVLLEARSLTEVEAYVDRLQALARRAARLVAHLPSQRCGIQEPHRISDCGEFDPSTP